MDTVPAQTMAIQSQQMEQEQRCPRCASVMAEVDRLVENGFAYIWYKCSAPDCTEQWLAMRPALAG